MILTKNIKTFIPVFDGQIIIEFTRPTLKDRNEYLAAMMDIESEGAARLNKLDELRIAFYGRFIADVYCERSGNREELTDESGILIGPKDLPEDFKTQAVMAAFETKRVLSKNV